MIKLSALINNLQEFAQGNGDCLVRGIKGIKIVTKDYCDYPEVIRLTSLEDGDFVFDCERK
jgi:hypothetical protein